MANSVLERFRGSPDIYAARTVKSIFHLLEIDDVGVGDRGGGTAAASHDRADAGQYLAQREWLAHHIVGSGVQGVDERALALHRGVENDT